MVSTPTPARVPFETITKLRLPAELIVGLQPEVLEI